MRWADVADDDDDDGAGEMSSQSYLIANDMEARGREHPRRPYARHRPLPTTRPEDWLSALHWALPARQQRRYDRNGRMYTREQFVNYYGEHHGTVQWQNAIDRTLDFLFPEEGGGDSALAPSQGTEGAGGSALAPSQDKAGASASTRGPAQPQQDSLQPPPFKFAAPAEPRPGQFEIGPRDWKDTPLEFGLVKCMGSNKFLVGIGRRSKTWISMCSCSRVG